MKQGDVLARKLCACLCFASATLLKFESRSRMGLTLLRWPEGKGWALEQQRARFQGLKGHRLQRAIPATHSSLKIRYQKEPSSVAYVPGVPAASPVPSSSLSMSRKLFCCDPPQRLEAHATESFCWEWSFTSAVSIPQSWSKPLRPNKSLIRNYMKIRGNAVRLDYWANLCDLQPFELRLTNFFLPK